MKNQRNRKLWLIPIILITMSIIVGVSTWVSVKAGDHHAASSNSAAVEAFKAAESRSKTVEGTTAHQHTHKSSEGAQGDVEGLLSGPTLAGSLAIRSGSSVEDVQKVADSGLVARYGSSDALGSTEEGANTILTAHRNTHGAQFHSITGLRLGDTLKVRVSGEGTHLYRVVRTAQKLSSPQDRSFNHIPDGLDSSGSYLTLLTCGSWLSDERWTVVAQLEK